MICRLEICIFSLCFTRKATMIYLAPLQGFTDFVFRRVYAETFEGVDRFFIPYIAVQGSDILRKYEREVLPANNDPNKAIPQILVKDEQETAFLLSRLADYGYTEVNLNLGCPYPMVTNRGRGAALLENPAALEKILNTACSRFALKLSVKLRVGVHNTGPLQHIVPVLNAFPLSEVILHPRTAKQLYKGGLSDEAFDFVAKHLQHSLVFNGDVFSTDDFKQRSKQFPTVTNWMLGRGILMNAFLPAQIKGSCFTEEEQRSKLRQFHDRVWEIYLQNADNPGNALNKQKQFWQYFSFHFLQQRRVFKSIKKLKSADGLASLAARIIQTEPLNGNV